MTSIETRLRSAIEQTAGQIEPGSIRPIKLAPASPSSDGQSARPVHLRLFAPLAAALAVAAVLTVLLAVPDSLPHRARPHHSTGNPVTTPDRIPRYYVALTQPTKWRFRYPLDVTIRLTATSRRLVTITPPTPGDTFSAVTAAADDRTFVLAENRWIPLSRSQLTRKPARLPVQFYLLTFVPGPDTFRLTRLWMSVPSQGQIQGLALTPDGTRLAVALGGNLIKIFALTKPGAVRTWAARGPAVHGVWMKDLSWTADGRYLGFDAFNWPARPWGLNVLDTAKPGTNLLADSHLLLPFGQLRQRPRPQCAGGALLSPDGRIIACALVQYVSRKTGPRYLPPLARREGYGDYSASTGELVRRVGITDNRGSYPDLLWISPSGGTLIVQPQGVNGPAVVISPRRTVVLPWPWVLYGGPDTVPGNLAAW